MIRGSTKIFLETLAGLAVVAVVLAGLLAWRLNMGPISVDTVTRYIESALSDPASGRRVTIGASGLIWDPDDHAIEVRADRVSVFDGDGQAVMVLPEMALRFHLMALLRGVFAPKAITLVRPALTVIRTVDGGWEVSALAETDDAPNVPHGGDIEQLRKLAESSLAELDGFRLLDARVMIDDRRAGATWTIPKLSIALQRVRGQVDAAASLDLDVDGTLVPMRGSAHLDAGYVPINADLGITGLRPAALAPRLDALSDLAALDLPLSGTLHYERPPSGSAAPELTFNISGEAGRIVRPELQGGELPVTGLSLRGSYGFDGERLALDELALALPTTSITVRAAAHDVTGDAAIEGTVSAAAVPLDDLRKYWPNALAHNARRWIIANMGQGTIRDASARFAVRRSGGAFAVDRIDGQMSVEGARVRYMHTQPALEQVSGLVRFDDRHFDIAVQSGRLRALKVDRAQLAITGLADPDQQMAIDVAVSGQLTDVLVLLDLPPFGYIHRFGIAPLDVSGDVTAQLSLKFPLIDHLSFDNVDLKATAALSGLRVPKAVQAYDLTGGRFDLNLDKAGMGLIGDGELGGVPAHISWDERFDRPVPYRRRFELVGTVSDAQRRALGPGLGLDSHIAGPFGLDITYTEQGDRHAIMAGTLDFAGAELKIEDLGWSKPAGQSATGRFEVGLNDGHLATLDRAELAGSGLSVKTSGAFGAQSRLAALDIRELKAGATDAAGRATWADDRMDLSLRGPSLDASALFGGEDVGGKPPRALTMSATFDRVVVGPNRELANVALHADSDALRWRTATIEARAGAGAMTLALGPGAEGRTLKVRADDAGAVLRIFGVSNGVQGGKLRVDGHYEDNDVRGDQLDARLAVEDYRFVRVPLLAKLLAVASVTGIPDLLSGDGIAFKDMTIQLAKSTNHLEVIDGRASGLALGLTAQGSIDGPDDVAELTGTIVPVNQVNRLFGKIPLIGEPLTGQGGGLFAFTYAVKGPLDNPSISVNPLSVLAPGFLRNLFRWMPDLTPEIGEAPVNKQ
jgi:hypothetical protein